MKPITLNGNVMKDQFEQIEMVHGPLPYLGVSVSIGHEEDWHYMSDSDLYRLELAIKKCRKALKKVKK